MKPSNLLLDGRGNVWVTDFGLAKAADGEDLTHTGDIVGTLRYMAPECFNGKADARSDVYSLGLTLYELLALRPAFLGKDRHQLLAEVVHGEPPRPRSVAREIPHDLETVVLKAIARDSTHRYQSAAALADDLRRFVDDRPVKARRVGVMEQLLAGAPQPDGGRADGGGAAAADRCGGGFGHRGVLLQPIGRRPDQTPGRRGQCKEPDSEAGRRAAQWERTPSNRANELMESGRLHADAGENDKALADYIEAVEQRPDMSAAPDARTTLHAVLLLGRCRRRLRAGFALHAPRP